METQLPKGTRDCPPEEKILKDKIVKTLKSVFELYGYAPLETPVIEKYDILASKYAGGEEITKEIFSLKDQGGRELALRYDLTVPLSRYISMNPSIKLPFKRYQIGEVFRDGPTASSRYRQFTQCDIDVIGCKEILADAEILSMADFVFKKLGLDAVIKINNRKLLNEMMEFFGVPEQKIEAVILSLDKLEKFGGQSVKNELAEKGITESSINKIMSAVGVKGTNDSRIIQIKNFLKKSEGIMELEELFRYLSMMEISFEFDVSLARGLSYYTGTVFEVFLNGSCVKSAVCAGGRYDRMIGQLVGNREYPAVGISFGLDRIYDAVAEKEPSKTKSTSKVYVIPIKTLGESINLIKLIRGNGINADIDLMGRSPSKNLEYANSLGIPYVIFIGEDELKQEKFKLKDMKSGKEEMMDIDSIIKILCE